MIDSFQDVENLELDPAYIDGYNADRKGKAWYDCPYDDYKRICLWQCGWHGSRIAFEKASLEEGLRLRDDLLAILKKHSIQ